MDPPTAPPVVRHTSSMSAASNSSVTAMDYINSQLALESEAREIMPYSFSTCTNPLGPLRQPVFSCKTCQSPTSVCPVPPTFTTSGAAAICYSCSISCHGDHELVEIFNKRNVVCDCGTTRMPQGSSCDLRKVAGEPPREGNRYCHNYWGRFCACDADYDPESERGTMYQCLLGDACGEDWFHDGCIVGEKREEKEAVVEKAAGEAVEGSTETAIEPVTTAPQDELVETGNEEDEEERPNGFPDEESFESFICWLCVEKNPWLKRYAGTSGFLPAVYKKDLPSPTPTSAPPPTIPAPAADSKPEVLNTLKRKADSDSVEAPHLDFKRAKTPDASNTLTSPAVSTPCTLPPPPSSTTPFSLFLTSTFRTHLCRCPICFPLLAPHPVLLEEEETYEPPLDTSSAGGDDAGSVHSGGSLFDRGERALGMVDRVRAIEGVMAYNNLKEKVKEFLKPFAERGEAVGADDVKRYFAELRGDGPKGGEGEKAGKEGEGDGRKEQSGY